MTKIHAQNTEKRQTQIRIKLDEMVEKYGIDKKAILILVPRLCLGMPVLEALPPIS